MNSHRQFQKQSDHSCLIASLFVSVVLCLICFVGYKGYTFVTGCFTPREATQEEVSALDKYISTAEPLYNAEIEQKGRFTLIYYISKQANNYDFLAAQMLDEVRHEGCTQITRIEIHDPITDEMTGHAVYTGRH